MDWVYVCIESSYIITVIFLKLAKICKVCWKADKGDNLTYYKTVVSATNPKPKQWIIIEVHEQVLHQMKQNHYCLVVFKRR